LTLLGHLVAHALPLRPILALNRLSALLGAASAAACAWAFDEMLRQAVPTHSRARNDRPLTARARAFAAAAAALAIAGSSLWWDQAQRFEVYSLHALLLALATGWFLRFAERGEDGPAFALALGLGFTAHMTTLLLAPAFLVLWAWRGGFTRLAARRARHGRALLLVAAIRRLRPASVRGLGGVRGRLWDPRHRLVLPRRHAGRGARARGRPCLDRAPARRRLARRGRGDAG